MGAGRILVVDDTPVNLMLLTSILQGAGHDVRASNSGRRALQMVERDPPDLLILDVNMPEMDGYALCRELRRKPGLETLPIIFISAHDDGAERVRAFDAGGDDYMTKPFEAVEVLARVATHLALRQSRQQIAGLQAALDETFDALCAALTGTVLDGRYRLARHLGSGVFRAERVGEGDGVAVRVQRPAPGARPASPADAAGALDQGVTAGGLTYVVTAGVP